MLPRSEFSFDKPEPVEENASLLEPDQLEQRFHQNLTLGIEQKLQENPMIKDVKLLIRKPVDRLSLSSWERKNCITMPQDLKDYYLSTNGFKLTWSLDHAGETLRIGEMSINSIQTLVPIETMATSSDSNTCGSSKSVPDKVNDVYLHMTFAELQHNLASCSPPGGSSTAANLTLSPQGKAFRLDSNRSNWGTVCLVYPKGGNSGENLRPRKQPNQEADAASSTVKQNVPPNVEIWFMDPSCQWHFLAPSFTHYYRMLLIHLGLPQWQYRFTPFGLSSWAEQIFWVVAPHLLQAPKASAFPNLYTGLWSSDYPAEAATPNPTPNVINMTLFKKKKKENSK